MEGPYVYLCLIPVVVWQRPTQHCKTIILQLKNKRKSALTGEDHFGPNKEVFEARGQAARKGCQEIWQLEYPTMRMSSKLLIQLHFQ